MAPESIQPIGSDQPHENMQPYLALNFMIALEGVYPDRN
jgi:microcystin-dependent protein